MAPTLTNAIHLVSSDSASGHVKQVVKPASVPRNNIRILSEQLTVGPCDVDPERHVELRRAWNAEIGDEYLETFGLDDLRAAVAGDRPVVVWATRAYADLVWLWWILDGLGRLGPLARPPLLVQPKPDDPRETVGGITPEAGRAAVDAARAISDDEFREGAELWRLFSSPDPRAFDEARSKGSPAFPEIHESAELHGAWFPRLHDGRLYLSEYDQCLLSSLTGQWLMPYKLLRHTIKIPGWLGLLRTFGSYSIPIWRLRAWAALGIIERQCLGCANGNLLEQDVFRLTDKTRTLLTDGLESVGDAPPVYVGGCRIHDPAGPWVRIADGDGWQIIPYM
jgi:hypothetical protein